MFSILVLLRFVFFLNGWIPCWRAVTGRVFLFFPVSKILLNKWALIFLGLRLHCKFFLNITKNDILIALLLTILLHYCWVWWIYDKQTFIQNCQKYIDLDIYTYCKCIAYNGFIENTKAGLSRSSCQRLQAANVFGRQTHHNSRKYCTIEL